MRFGRFLEFGVPVWQFVYLGSFIVGFVEGPTIIWLVFCSQHLGSAVRGTVPKVEVSSVKGFRSSALSVLELRWDAQMHGTTVAFPKSKDLGPRASTVHDEKNTSHVSLPCYTFERSSTPGLLALNPHTTSSNPHKPVKLTPVASGVLEHKP